MSPGSSSIPRQPSTMTHVVQPELARVERAVFDAIVQRETHQVNVLDPALLQIMSEPGVAAMSIVEKRAVTVDRWIGSLVENMSDSARVE